MTPNQTLVAYGNVIKKITLSLFLVVACNAFAQVGVGTQTPATTLDVVGAAGTTPGALNTIDGIAVPVVTDDMTTTATAGSRISQLVYSNNAASTGYYFWNGTAWTAMSGGAAAAPSIRDNVTNEALTAADLNGYVIVTEAIPTPFDLSTLTTAVAGDTITIVAFEQCIITGTRTGSDSAPNGLGAGIRFLYTGVDWISVMQN
jgi:hypothetical protein